MKPVSYFLYEVFLLILELNDINIFVLKDGLILCSEKFMVIV